METASQALHNGMQTSTNTSTQNPPLPDAWVAAIFVNSWNTGTQTSQFPTQQRTDEMIKEWGKALANVQPHKIKHALSIYRTCRQRCRSFAAVGVP